MSDGSGRQDEQTAAHRAMSDAIAAYMADECDGAILDGFVLQASGRRLQDLDSDRTQYVFTVADGQSTHSSVGLSVMLADALRGYASSPGDD